MDDYADHALAMILDLTRKIAANAAKVKAGGWGLAVPLQALFALKYMTMPKTIAMTLNLTEYASNEG